MSNQTSQPKGIGLASRAGGVIAATVACALAFALLLSFLKFDQKLLDVTGSRLSIVADQVREQSETGLSLGLELSELKDIDNILKRAGSARGVSRIDVADEKGQVLFSTIAAAIGTNVNLKEAKSTFSKEYRQLVAGNELILAVRLVDGFGHNVGDVMVRASLANQRAALEKVREELLASSVPVIVIALLLTLVVVRLTVNLFGRSSASEQAAGENSLEVNPDRLHLTLESRLDAAITKAEAEIVRLEKKAP